MHIIWMKYDAFIAHFKLKIGMHFFAFLLQATTSESKKLKLKKGKF